MAYSRVTKIGDGVSTQFTVNFALDYLDQSHVTARVGTEVDGLGDPVYRTITFLSTNLMQISGAPAGIGVKILFERTVKKDELIVNFNNGDVMDEVNLDTAQKQAVMAVQEVLDGRFGVLTEDLDFGGYTGVNTRAPTGAGDLTNKAYVDTSVATLNGIAPEIVQLGAIRNDIVTVAAIDDDVTTVADISADVIALAANAGVLSGTASALNMVEDVFTGDGAETEFELSATPASAANVDVWVGGAVQTLADYSVTGNVLTISPAVSIGVPIQTRTRTQVSANDMYAAVDAAEDAAASAALSASAALAATIPARLPYGDGSAFQMPLPTGKHYFPAGAWRDATTDVYHFAFTVGYRHSKSKFGELVIVKSRDCGRSLFDWITVPGFNDRGIQHAAGGPMGAGRVGFLLTAVDEADAVTIHFVYSDNFSSSSPSWTRTTVSTSDGFFGNGPMLSLPASEGGHDTLGFRWYGHSAGRIRAVSTTDNGATFTDTTILAKPVGKTLTEPFVAKLSTGSYLGMLRDDDGGVMMTMRGATQVSFGSLTATTLALGANPVSFTERDSTIFTAAFARQGTPIGGHNNAILHYVDTTTQLVNHGTLSTTTPAYVTMCAPALLGYPFYLSLPYGAAMVVGAGEEQTGSDNPNSSQAFVLAPPSTAATPLVLPNPNLFRNGLFQQSARGNSFTLDPSVLTPIVDCWRWSGSGASGSASLAALDVNARLLFDVHVDKFLAIDTSSDPDDYPNIEQYLWADDFHKASGSALTLTVCGIGSIPGQLEIQVTRFYGSGGSAPDVYTAVVMSGRASTNGTWRAQGMFTIPTLVGLTVGTDPYIRVQIRASAFAAWAGGFVSAKLELGTQSTPYPSDSYLDTPAGISPYVENYSFAATKTVPGAIGIGTSGANVLTVIPFTKKFRIPPTVTLTGFTNIRFWNTAANVSAIAAAPYNISHNGFETNLTMASGSLATHAVTSLQTTGAFSYLVDAEA